VTEEEMRQEGRGFRWSWQKGMTDAEVQAEEDEWERRYQAQKEAAEKAFRDRGGLPPQQSQVGGPPPDWRRWNALLDGVPVGSCWAFDVDAGWVEVWVVAERTGKGTMRMTNESRRRLYGKVTPVSCEEWARLKAESGLLEVAAGEEKGEPVPGTELLK